MGKDVTPCCCDKATVQSGTGDGKEGNLHLTTSPTHRTPSWVRSSCERHVGGEGLALLLGGWEATVSSVRRDVHLVQRGQFPLQSNCQGSQFTLHLCLPVFVHVRAWQAFLSKGPLSNVLGNLFVAVYVHQCSMEWNVSPNGYVPTVHTYIHTYIHKIHTYIHKIHTYIKYIHIYIHTQNTYIHT
jgi:hypothetical protein